MGELLEVLSATKTAVLPSYTQDSQVTYVINILNSGTVTFSGLSITDNLGEYPFGTGTLVPLVISGFSVPAGGVATVIYVAEANQYAPLALDSIITNSATISGSGDREWAIDVYVYHSEYW